MHHSTMEAKLITPIYWSKNFDVAALLVLKLFDDESLMSATDTFFSYNKCIASPSESPAFSSSTCVINNMTSKKHWMPLDGKN